MSELRITRGIPGSGKSTWARQQQAESPNLWRVNRDDLRAMVQVLWPYGRPDCADYEDLLTALQLTAVRVLLDGGVSVVVDDTNLDPDAVEAWHRVADRCGADLLVQDFTDVPLSTCLGRDSLRPPGERVGEEVIRRMHEKYLAGGAL